MVHSKMKILSQVTFSSTEHKSSWMIDLLSIIIIIRPIIHSMEVKGHKNCLVSNIESSSFCPTEEWKPHTFGLNDMSCLNDDRTLF